jgi:two-component system, LytTR family, sensor kinase
MKNNKYWFFQIFGWFIFGLYDLSTLYLRDRLTKEEVMFTSAFLLFCIVVTEIYHFIIKKYQWNRLLIEKLVPRVAISVTLMTILINTFVVLFGIMYREKVAFKLEFAIGFLFYSFALSMLWSTFYFLWKYINSNEELEIEKIKMQMTLKDLELKNIKLNLQPHFIFNALNSIRSLIFENQDKAREAVMQLSNILRNSLITEKEELVLLEKEMKIIEDYLALESIRYEERLIVKYNIDKNCLSTLVPPMMLQTLVENAIKHGISQSSNGGFINIDVFENINSKTIIKIENTGNFSPEENADSTKFGLNASLIRLNYLFGKLASFSISNSMNNSVISVLEIPN